MANNSLKNLFIIIAVLAITAGYSYWERDKVIDLYNLDDNVLMVEKLPEFKFQDLEGNEILSSTLKEISPLLVIHFWGTWCPPCIPEFPEFIDYAEKMKKEDNVKFVVVAVNDKVEAVKRFIKRTPNISENVLIAVDPQGKGMEAFGTVKVPETHVYLNGRSAKRFLGPQKWQNEYYLKFLKDLI